MSEPGRGGPVEWLSLEDGERVFLRMGPSTNLLLAGFGLAFVILILLSIAVGRVADLQTARSLSLVIIVLTVGTILLTFFTIVRHEYVLTDRRACVGVGLRSKDLDQVDVDRLQDVVVEQSRWQRWLRMGDVRFVTDGERTLTFAFVERPYTVYQEVLDRIEMP